ncbi:hypothetical protein OKC48_25775 [Methylorubrum extorquens]|uniref:hypothetical protein n=1 Tax=Methylorubrum extorquens TaxID=408 RepID=UPI0022372631|nr:hypothetical protein [Methylorubrum extorquens]UYW26619.1 hypothetical protein OKC48_25775 [Methylorubrum extorquens]
MPDPTPTVGELFKAKSVTDDEVNAAVDAYLTDLEAGIFPIADGYVVDVDAAVVKHLWASHVIANEESSPGLRRAAVRTAILLAQAQKA